MQWRSRLVQRCTSACGAAAALSGGAHARARASAWACAVGQRPCTPPPAPLRKECSCQSNSGRCFRQSCFAVFSGGCLPQPRWAVCATGAGAHQGQTNREGEKDIWWTARTARGGTGHLGRTETQRGRLWTACGQRCVDSKNSQTTPATTSTSSIRQLLGAADTQTAHPATFSTVPTCML